MGTNPHCGGFCVKVTLPDQELEEEVYRNQLVDHELIFPEVKILFYFFRGGIHDAMVHHTGVLCRTHHEGDIFPPELSNYFEVDRPILDDKVLSF